LLIADFKKTENRNSTVGAAFSRDFYDLNGFYDVPFTVYDFFLDVLFLGNCAGSIFPKL
jgi:hypothetical protein